MEDAIRGKHEKGGKYVNSTNALPAMGKRRGGKKKPLGEFKKK